MGKFRKRMFDNDTSDTDSPDARYDIAFKRVKRIKGFYIHLLVYVLVNAFLIISSYIHIQHADSTIFNWETFSTAFFWGIGLLAHGVSVFGGNIFFGSKWEENKIQEFMDKEKNNRWE
jgi:hypothetical protein